MFQTTIPLYTELQQIGYTTGHQYQILSLLSDLQVHSTDEVMTAGGKQYNARILELRREGWDIESVRQGMMFGFVLRGRRRW